MKGMIITPGGAVNLLLPGHLYHNMDWVSWDTPAPMVCDSGSRARARVQYILDMEGQLHHGDGTIPRPTLSFSPSYCTDTNITTIIGLDMSMGCIDPLPPVIRVLYTLCGYNIPTRAWYETESVCSYVVPALHPSEYNLAGDRPSPSGSTTGSGGTFGIEDMLGGILCTHVEGTQPCNALREVLRALGHLPHTFHRAM